MGLPLHLSLHASRHLRILLVLLATLALVALLASRAPLPLIVLLPLLTWSGLSACTKGLPLELVLHRDGSALRRDNGGAEWPLQVVFLHERGPLGVLAIEYDGVRRYLPWATDTLPRTMRRELRLWLRAHAPTVAPSAATR